MTVGNCTVAWTYATHESLKCYVKQTYMSSITADMHVVVAAVTGWRRRRAAPQALTRV